MDATGTVECFAVAMQAPIVNRVMLDSHLACYPHAAADRYISLAYNFTGGSLLRWARDTFGEAERAEADRTGQDVYEMLTAEMAEEPTELLVQPHFTMAGTPYMDPDPVGGVVGLTLSTSRAEFLRSLLEGASYEMKLNLERFEEAGVGVEEFRATGGGAKSDLWLQLKADMFKRPIVRLGVSEAASLGMSFVAGAASGAYGDPAEAAKELVSTRETFEPNRDNAAFYDMMLESYRELYPALKSWQDATEFSSGGGD
jgi:xylulokinase